MNGILISGELSLGGLNRRKASRKRVLLGGTVSDTEGLWTRECTIRQISMFGAQIAFDAELMLPQEVFLIDTKHCMGYRARIAWLRPGRAGLEFRQTFPVDEALPQHLQFLMRALITRKLGQVDFLRANGKSLEEALRFAGLSAPAYARWTDPKQAKDEDPITARLHELESQNAMLLEHISMLARRVLDAQGED